MQKCCVLVNVLPLILWCKIWLLKSDVFTFAISAASAFKSLPLKLCRVLNKLTFLRTEMCITVKVNPRHIEPALRELSGLIRNNFSFV